MSNPKKVLSIAVIALAIPLTVYLTIKGIQYFSRASSTPATLSFSQNNIILDNKTPTAVNVVLNSHTDTIGFASFQFTFDNTKIRLASEITTTNLLKKSTSIIKTTMAEANTTGVVTVVLGLDPADIGSPPSGSINLASLSFIALDTSTSTSTLAFQSSKTEVVDMTPVDLTVTSTDTAVTVNPQPPTPSPTVTPSPTDMPTSTPTPTQTATATPEPTATATVTPTPTATATATPPASMTLNFKVKLQGSTGGKKSAKAAVTIKDGSTIIAQALDVTITISATGDYYSGVMSSNIPPGTYDVYIKVPTYLQKKFTAVALTGGANDKDFTGSTLLVGDFTGNNVFDLLDIGLILSQYTDLSIPVTPSNEIYDVNADGIINLLDISLVLSNYTDLQIPGD